MLTANGVASEDHILLIKTHFCELQIATSIYEQTFYVTVTNMAFFTI